MDADERLSPLKKAYADIIFLNTSKEAAARVIVSERRSLRFQHELIVAKEEGIQMMLRLKKVMESKVDETLDLFNDLQIQHQAVATKTKTLLWHKKNGATLPVERGEMIDPAAQAAAECLSNRALQKGSKDNITVIVVDLKAQRKFKIKT